MARRATPLFFLSFFALAAVTATAAAAAAAAAASPAHSKGKSKGKSSCPNPVACSLATETELQAVAASLEQLWAYQALAEPQTLKASYVVDSTAEVPSCTVVDSQNNPVYPGGPGYAASCNAGIMSFMPESVQIFARCPDDTPIAAQYGCRAYTSTAQSDGYPVQTLPITSSLSTGGLVICTASTPPSLPDGVTVNLEATLTCSGGHLPPTQGAAKANGDASASDPAAAAAEAVRALAPRPGTPELAKQFGFGDGH